MTSTTASPMHSSSDPVAHLLDHIAALSIQWERRRYRGHVQAAIREAMLAAARQLVAKADLALKGPGRSVRAAEFDVDLNDVAEWVGLHHRRNWDAEDPTARQEWILRYAESHDLKPLQVYEVAAAGHDPLSEDQDDLVVWVAAASEETVRSAIQASGAAFCGVALGWSLDDASYTLPEQAAELSAELQRLASDLAVRKQRCN